MVQQVNIYSKVLYIPPGIEIKKNNSGFGLFAIRDFKQWELVYECDFPLIENADDLALEYATPVGEVLMNPSEHFTLTAENKLIFWGFSSFTNHSCSPNIINITICEDNKFASERAVASHSITKGTEITMSYYCITYGDEADFANHFTCECGSRNCCMEFKGFMSLEPKMQEELLPYCYPYVKLRYNEARSKVTSKKLV